jgi:hypothetical protein
VVCTHPGCEWIGQVGDLQDHIFQCELHPDRIPPVVAGILPSNDDESDEEAKEEIRGNAMAKLFRQNSHGLTEILKH